MKDPYVYPGTNVLKNKFNIQDNKKLQAMENQLSATRILELEKSPIKGDFDYKHLQAVHNHIFKDVYDWAGKPRVIGISKPQAILNGESVNYPHPKAPFDNLAQRADYVFQQLKKDNYLVGLNDKEFDAKLTHHAAEIWEAHPFREGNTRTTLTFMQHIAKNAGREFDRTPFEAPNSRDAFVLAYAGDSSRLSALVKQAREMGETSKEASLDPGKSFVSPSHRMAVQLYEKALGFNKDQDPTKHNAYLEKSQKIAFSMGQSGRYGENPFSKETSNSLRTYFARGKSNIEKEINGLRKPLQMDRS